MHGSLVFVLIFGTAFFSSKEPPLDPPKIIELIPNMKVTDGPTRGGGGSPAPAPAPTPAPEPVPQRAAPPPPAPAPTPEPERPRPQPVVEPPKPKHEEKRETISELPTHKPKKPTPKPVNVEKPKPTPPKPAVDISNPVVRDTKQKEKEKQALIEAAERAEKAAEERIRNQRIAALAGARRSLEKNISNDSPIEALGGSGGGGAAEINYRDLVFSKYDKAWIAPTDVDDDEATTKARVVIARNGNVLSADVIKASGNAQLDRSVRQVLSALRYIHPFPEGSRDSQRTFIINFNLKSKRGIG